MKLVRYYITVIIMGAVFYSIRFIIGFFAGLVGITNVLPWDIIIAALAVVGLTIWFLDWNMKR